LIAASRAASGIAALPVTGGSLSLRMPLQKSPKNLSVIPAKAGYVGQWREIHSLQMVRKDMDPLLQGDDCFLQ
jgi:hypothetical protein